MQALTEQAWRLRPPQGIFDSTVVGNLFPDVAVGARRALVHRAVQAGEVLRLKPGLFALAQPYHPSAPHPFALASLLHSPSYVSMESALSHHGFIPEAVHEVTSVTSKRSRTFTTPLGIFAFSRVPCTYLKAGVRAEDLGDNLWGFIATPLRALADTLYTRRDILWQQHGISFLTDSLRIEEDDLTSIPASEFKEVCASIQNKRTRNYLENLQGALKP